MREFMKITKALADENRVRMLLALRGGELCVCQITELLGLAPSTVSKHLDILRQAGLIESRKSGRWIYCRLPDKPTAHVKGAIRWLLASLRDDPQALRDAKRLRGVLKMDKEVLCCRYNGAPGASRG